MGSADLKPKEVGPLERPVRPECTCGHMLACGAFRGWYCGAHGDVIPHQYAVDAARELHAKYLAAANELYEIKRHERELRKDPHTNGTAPHVTTAAELRQQAASDTSCVGAFARARPGA